MSRPLRILALTLLAALAIAAPAQAHAKLERTLPADGAHLQDQPGSVAFYFGEAIEASFGAIRVLNSQGVEVETGSTFRPQGSDHGLAIALRPNLPDGTYTATYRIISADSHPVAGGISFAIGNPSAGGVVKLSAAELSGPTAGKVTSVAFWIVRLLGYAALALAIGGAVFFAWLWTPALAAAAGGGEEWLRASRAANRRLRAIVLAGTAVGAAASVLALPLEAASAGGTSFWSALNGTALSEVLDTRFGSLMLLRIGAWLLLGIALGVIAAGSRLPALRVARIGADGIAMPRSASPELVALLMLPIGSLLVSPALVGHARTQSPTWLGMPADILHVTAMTVWLGGLVALVVAVPAALTRLQAADRARLLQATLARFSALALIAVLVLAASGTVQAVVELDSVPALVTSGYGRAIVAKVLLLLALVGLGALNRQRLLPALARGVEAGADAARTVAALARSMRLEVALIAVVLGVTAVLVAYAPAGTGSAAPAQAAPAASVAAQPIEGRAHVGSTALRYTVDPATVGMNTINLYLRRARVGGAYTRAKEVSVELSLPARGLGPLHPDVREVGPGHYAVGAQLGLAGDWQLLVTVRTSEFDEDQTRIKVPIR